MNISPIYFSIVKTLLILLEKTVHEFSLWYSQTNQAIPIISLTCSLACFANEVEPFEKT